MTNETLGTLDLKIARLKRRLKVLASRQAMSERYPDYYSTLRAECNATRQRLQQLGKQRQALTM